MGLNGNQSISKRMVIGWTFKKFLADHHEQKEGEKNIGNWSRIEKIITQNLVPRAQGYI